MCTETWIFSYVISRKNWNLYYLSSFIIDYFSLSKWKMAILWSIQLVQYPCFLIVKLIFILPSFSLDNWKLDQRVQLIKLENILSNRKALNLNLLFPKANFINMTLNINPVIRNSPKCTALLFYIRQSYLLSEFINTIV